MTGRGLHGPLSPVGAALGILLVAAPYALGATDGAAWVAWVVGPVVGLALLAVPGRPRHLGIGLVASALTLPLILVVLAAAVTAS